jgi:MFS family permease
MAARTCGDSLRRWFRDVMPARRDERRYVMVTLVNNIGNGMFLPGTAVFATRIVGLRPQQVGITFALAGVAGLVAAATTGGLADRFGARRTALAAYLLQAVVYLLYCVVRSFPAFTLLACLASASNFCMRGANSTQVYAIVTEREQRVRLQAQARSMLSVGFSIGAGLAGLALAVKTTSAYYALAIGDAATFVAAAALTLRLPETPVTVGRSKRKALPALRNPPFLLATVLNAVLGIHVSLMMLVVPLWIITRTSAPSAIVGILLIVNTIICVAFQVRASAGADTLAGSVRKARWAAAMIMPGCLVVGMSGGVPVVLAIALLTAGYLFLTFGEVLQVASQWGMSYSIAPAGAQGHYLAAFGMSSAAQNIIGAGLAGLVLLNHGLGGWVSLGLAVVLAAAVLGPVIGWTARTVQRQHAEYEQLAEVGADSGT